MPKHKRTMLNCAAGGLPLVKSDFPNTGIVRIVNFDPLSEFSGSQRRTMSMMPFIFPDVEYYCEFDELQENVRKNSVDLIVSVSPFGFPLINELNNGLLKVNGYVVVLGNKGNKHVMDGPMKEGPFKGMTPVQNPYLYEHPVYHKNYTESILPAAWVLVVANKLKANAPSHTSGLQRTTNLDVMRIFQKLR